MHQIQVYIEAVQKGDWETLHQLLPDPTPPAAPESDEDDPWDFLNDFDDRRHWPENGAQHQEIQDTRGFNLLDCAYEYLLARRGDNQPTEALSHVFLELIIQKRLRCSVNTLGMVLPAVQLAGLNKTEQASQCFRRTVGLFAEACFGFGDFGKGSPLALQKLATWGMYGIAYKINNATNLTQAELSPRGNRIHPALFRYLTADPEESTPLRRFIDAMCADRVMRQDLIRDGHAWRMLHEIKKTPFFEEEILRHFADSGSETAPLPALNQPLEETLSMKP